MTRKTLMKPSCYDPFDCPRVGSTKTADAVTPRRRFTSAQSGLAASYRSACGFPWNRKRNAGARILTTKACPRRHTRGARKRYIARLRE